MSLIHLKRRCVFVQPVRLSSKKRYYRAIISYAWFIFDNFCLNRRHIRSLALLPGRTNRRGNHLRHFRKMMTNVETDKPLNNNHRHQRRIICSCHRYANWTALAFAVGYRPPIQSNNAILEIRDFEISALVRVLHVSGHTRVQGPNQ